MFEIRFNYSQLLRPGDVVALENCQPVTAADKVTKDHNKDCRLSILRRLDLFFLLPGVMMGTFLRYVSPYSQIISSSVAQWRIFLKCHRSVRIFDFCNYLFLFNYFPSLHLFSFVFQN